MREPLIAALGFIPIIRYGDFSRLGRNYIEVGELMDEVFPRFNVRLIAINDHYDSRYPHSDADDIIIPFKNLINEQYLRDFSVKIRSNLNIKRKNGDFVAAFAPYGYSRDAADKHRLVVDEHAANIVRDIFKWKIKGMSQQRIADLLNEMGEPSPLEYKKRQGSKLSANFQTHSRAMWSAVSVGRILHNPVYEGTLIQGKETTLNYKVKKRMRKPEEEWYVAKNAHKPIVDAAAFEMVGHLLGHDTRTPPKKEMVMPLAGLLRCGDCGNSIIRKKVNQYSYYVCATHKAGKGCTAHAIKPADLEAAVMKSVTGQIAIGLEMEDYINGLGKLPNRQIAIRQIAGRLSEREGEIKECEQYKRSLYEDYRNGDISKEDYIAFGQDYNERIETLRLAIDRLKQESERLISGDDADYKQLEAFRHNRNVTSLTRQLAVNLIGRVDVYEGKRVTVQFRYNFLAF